MYKVIFQNEDRGYTLDGEFETEREAWQHIMEIHEVPHLDGLLWQPQFPGWDVRRVK